MGAPLILTVDRQNQTLVSYLGSVPSLPSLFQSNVRTLRVQVVDPTGNLSNPYSLVDLSSYGMRVSVGDPALTIGTTGGTVLALQDTFVWNSGGSYFEADLALNTSNIDTFLGTLSNRTANFEINLTLSGNRITILQTSLVLKAVVDELTSVAPSPVDQYLTAAECKALFVKLVGDLGQRIVFRSANGVYGREIGVNDDGTGLDDIITL